MFTEEQRAEILRLMNEIQNDTNAFRLQHVVEELISIRKDFYPIPEEAEALAA